MEMKMYDDLILQCRNCVDSLCGECKYKPLQKPGNFVKCMNALLSEAADAIEELSKPRWISVTERLPEIDEYVLAYLFNCSPYIVWIDHTGQWQAEEFWLDAEEAPKAWMPLPEPPELVGNPEQLEEEPPIITKASPASRGIYEKGE